MAGFHINEENQVGVCNAKIKCRFGDLNDDHWSTKAEAQAAMRDRLALKAAENTKLDNGPMGVIPMAHQNLHLKSDAFYNTTGVVDSDAIDAIASYHYHRVLRRLDPSDNENEIRMLKAKEKLLSTAGGKDYKGFKYDDPLPEGTDVEFRPIPESKVHYEPESLPVDGAVRYRSDYEEQVSTYLSHSVDFVKKLEPQEHSVVAYWTSCGSYVGATAAYGASNPFGLQCDDPTDEDYFDGVRLLRTMDRALKKAELPEKKLLYRGLPDGMVPKEVINELFQDDEDSSGNRELSSQWAKEAYPVGGEVSFGMPSSATDQTGVAINFSGSMVVLEVISHRAAPVGVISAWGASEREWILPRDTKYRVVGHQERAVYEHYGSWGRKLETKVFVIQLEQL